MSAPVAILKPYGMPPGIDPRTWRQEVQKRLNDLLDRAMSLITALDLMEADCDLEDGADAEPWLGWCALGPQTVRGFHDGRGSPYDDRELDNSDDEDDGTEEPTLGAPNRTSQVHWADGARGDHEREEDHDAEPENDAESAQWSHNPLVSQDCPAFH
ncbi:hypothetical protein [Mesorhizobium sp. B2-4-17]|uniref:hypothetical protein n=1 Tax=Mesorhizobium sp. B2-4-17 TaxID=2589932 RepID=UPI0011285B5A|nr:hypothetical protein [Mesorhizobium sp. B2-4-17]TPK85329.1 hypothetical protein FJ548_17460 [Mesorhizobium sp. B2-4-17]